MNAFRAKTALWSTAEGHVDATSNFRPVQSNPSCISKCAGSSDLEYCPDGTELAEDEGESSLNQMMALWISLGVLVAILLVVLLVRCCRTTKQKPLDKPRPPRTEMTKVPTPKPSHAAGTHSIDPLTDTGKTQNVTKVESAMDQPYDVDTVFDEPHTERMSHSTSPHSSERVNNI